MTSYYSSEMLINWPLFRLTKATYFIHALTTVGLRPSLTMASSLYYLSLVLFYIFRFRIAFCNTHIEDYKAHMVLKSTWKPLSGSKQYGG